MSRLVGTVHFKSTIDGTRMPADAKKMGREAGLAGGKGFNEAWDKELESGLTREGKKTLEHWKRRGKLDGLTYGSGLEVEFRKLSSRLNDAFADFQGISVNAGFMDEFAAKSANWERDVNGLRENLELLHRQGGITDFQFRNATKTIDTWSVAQREAELNTRLNAVEIERQAESMRSLRAELEQHARARQNVLDVERDHRRSLMGLDREWETQITLVDRLTLSLDKNGDAAKGMSLKWGDLSHNARRWTLIIGAVTAALPELAGLSSAAGSGLLVLGGAATGAGIGIGTAIAGIVGLNKDLEELPPSLRAARSGLDDFKGSFSDLNEVITDAAFRESEAAWRSLAGTVRSLGPEFAYVGDKVGDLLDDLAAGIAPGTKNYQNLAKIVGESGDQFDMVARSAGRLGEGLLSAFANPQMQRSIRELLGWIDELADGFADFAEGDSFDDWLRHGRAVFGEFGELLATTGGLLDDLVTDASINRLTTFMDNLGTFLDTGGRGILQFADALNAFGIAADLLASIGTALEPIREPVVELGEELNRLAGGAIDGIAGTLGVLATAAAPVVQALADITEAIPTEALTVLAGTATATAAAFGVLRGIQGVQGAIAALGAIPGVSSKAGAALSGVASKAGLIGAGVVGVIALSNALDDLWRSANKMDDKSRAAVSSSASLKDAYDDLGRSAFGMSYELTDASGALDQLASVGTGIEDFFPTLAATFTDTGRQANQLAATLDNLDAPLANLANTSVSAASEKFSEWVQQLGATDAQALNMLNTMPEFKAVLQGVADQTGELGTEQDVLAIALGRATVETQGNKQVLVELGDQATMTRQEVDNLAGAIRGFGDASLTTRDANRQFEQALLDLNGQLGTNGATLDLTTQAGLDNSAAIDQAITSTNNFAASIYEETQNQELANQKLAEGRQRLIEMLNQFDPAGVAAGKYNDILDEIPPDITTITKLEGVQAAEAALSNLTRTRTAYIQTQLDAARVPGQRPVNKGQFASGGLLPGPRHILAGEAGPEAIVPLNRALGQVDPSVRWLSAIAQGKVPAMASGGVVGGGSQVTIEAGAIVVQGAYDPRRTALDVMDEIAERISS